MIVVYTLTIFLSSALVFMIQPMIGKMLLPILGGSPSVWNVCLVFFQAVLLAGYLYAHLSLSRLVLQRQVVLQMILLMSAVGWLAVQWHQGGGPIHPSESLYGLTEIERDPTLPLLGGLLALIGVPFFVLSSSAPVLQRWFSHTDHASAANPYFLYAASNVGSMLSLLAYPFLINRYLTLDQQTKIFTIGLGALTLCFLGCASFLRTSKPAEVGSPSQASSPPTHTQIIRWVFLSFIPSALLMAETGFLSSEVISHPLLWVVMLAIYLLTFIIVFSATPWIAHTQAVRWAAPAALLLTILIAGKSNEPTWLIVGVHIVAYFLLTLVCHGELVREKPDAEHLTAFYLGMSFGGMLGGIFTSLAAPLLFRAIGLAEYPIIIGCACLILGRSTAKPVTKEDVLFACGIGGLTLALVQFFPRQEGAPFLANLIYAIPAALLMFAMERLYRFGLGAVAILAVAWFDPGPTGRTLFLERNFYGVLRVTYDAERNCNLIIHGNTLHSLQSRDPREALIPTAYYFPEGPISTLFKEIEKRHYRRIGVAGLGAGGIACYARPGQHWTFYEIDPTMKQVAEDPQYFTFLRDCFPKDGATYQVKLGDARLLAAKEPDEAFDVLILNAFTSSSPPIHLLTQEAMKLYASKLQPNGLLIYNASNRHLRLEPVLAAQAHALGLSYRNAQDYSTTPEQRRLGKENCSWVVLAKDPNGLAFLRDKPEWIGPPDKLPTPWTDQFSDLLGVMR